MLKEYLKSIADAFRAKLGSTNAINAQNFPSKVTEVYDKGRTDEWSKFWDALQQNGQRTDYNYAFYTNGGLSYLWTEENFKPKYSIKPTTANRCFNRIGVKDVAKLFEDRGIVLDTSQCTDTAYLFAQCDSLHLPTLDLSVSKSITGFIFYSSVKKIDKIIWSETITDATNPFVGCWQLSEFESEGTLAISVSFASCPLTVETIKGLLLCLKNYAGTSNAGTHILTLSDTSKTAMAELGTIEEFGGKTYDAYLTDIGWNLA